jgi:hypothetical protein
MNQHGGLQQQQPATAVSISISGFGWGFGSGCQRLGLRFTAGTVFVCGYVSAATQQRLSSMLRPHSRLQQLNSSGPPGQL